jgi:hypothetical protein
MKDGKISVIKERREKRKEGRKKGIIKNRYISKSVKFSPPHILRSLTGMVHGGIFVVSYNV